ncbi:hypothetical protein QUF80_12040 [Desulfococcaceae bacterium HSG8]|nr:hypothetical protein [Desulfococcaceae bacterium HSG8]
MSKGYGRADLLTEIIKIFGSIGLTPDFINLFWNGWKSFTEQKFHDNRLSSF